MGSLGYSKFPMTQRLKHLPGMQETRVQSLGREDPLEREMATHSGTLAWRFPWREEPGRLQSMGSQTVGHNWATSLSLSFTLGYSIKLAKKFHNILWKNLKNIFGQPNTWKIMSSVNRDSVPSPFQNECLLFFSVLNWDGESGLLCFVPDHRRKVSCLSSLRIILSVAF